MRRELTNRSAYRSCFPTSKSHLHHSYELRRTNPYENDHEKTSEDVGKPEARSIVANMKSKAGITGEKFTDDDTD